MSTYPLQDAVAIVGLGTTEYVRDGGHKTKGHLAVEACINAITDAGLTAADVDGLCGSNFQASPQYVQEGLGIPALTWWCSAWGPFTQLLSEAVHAVFAGACSVAVVYQGQVRTVRTSSSVDMTDPVRSVPDPGRSFDHHSDAQYYRPYGGRRGTYAGYMNRYMNEYHLPRESFGLVAVNNRSHATANPHAVLKDPLSMNDYLNSRFVRFPMCLNDIDYAIDGGDAVVVTTLERARDLKRPPVIVHAMAFGEHENPGRDAYRSVASVGQVIAMNTLWGRSALNLNDVDLVYPYDGFTVITLRWLENFGFCDIGDAGNLLRDAWNDDKQIAEIDGRVLMNTHGGSLSDGATQGAGHIREAVTQLRGDAGPRQAATATTALLGIGGLFFNSVAMLMRADR